MLLLFLSYLILSVFSETLNNKYDTHNQECTRVRKAWHLMEESERQLFIEAIVILRNHDEFDKDWYMILSDIHKVAYVHGVVHQSSANHFWHGYILWELESRIRDLGGKFSCFAMPYYDTTLDAGRESNPTILDGIGGMGTCGDQDDDGAVTDFANFMEEYDESDPANIFWIDNYILCDATVDSMPYCTIKRHCANDSYDGEIIDTIEKQAPYFQHGNEYDVLITFLKTYQQGTYDPMGFMTTPSRDLFGSLWGGWQSYEPVWWLYHSFIQYQISLWTDCHGYQKDPVSGYTGSEFQVVTLDDDDYAFYCEENNYCTFDLDNKLYFDILTKSKSENPLLNELLVNQGLDISIRKLWDHSEWNVRYEIGDYLQRSQLYDNYCNFDNYLDTNKWIQDKSLYKYTSSQQNKNKKIHKKSSFAFLDNYKFYITTSIIVSIVILIIGIVKINYYSQTEKIKYTSLTQNNYGSVEAH